MTMRSPYLFENQCIALSEPPEKTKVRITMSTDDDRSGGILVNRFIHERRSEGERPVVGARQDDEGLSMTRRL